MTKPIFTGTEWNLETIQQLHDACQVIAKEELNLDTYPNQFEIITSEQMLDAYTSIGMPVNYGHWSYGKSFLREEENYRSGKSGLAYELVINSNPCINYLMEENSATLQALVIAHAAFGHNSFFKNNYMFTQWTDADGIVDYLLFAKHYIEECEEKYGYEAVELMLDSCHALQNQGIDRYKRPKKLSVKYEKAKQKSREEYLQKQVNELWRITVPTQLKEKPKETRVLFPTEPQENILKFIEKNSPVLATWQREIIRIVRKISQYFYPQRQTQVMNEGWATYTHSYIMNRLYDKGLITEGAMLEFISVNSNVLYQANFDDPHFNGRFNPYKLGYEMYKDIERICKNPTTEDLAWFPEFAGKNNHLAVITDAMKNYRDESFIAQFLSPKLMRDFKMFRIGDEDSDFYNVSNIHNDEGYKKIRRALSNQYNITKSDPNIQVVDANLDTDRHLVLHHYSIDNKLLDYKSTVETLRHVKRLWGFEPILESYNTKGELIDEFML